mgnify:CR=1 FL=1|tara:strand:- start:597 stop:791 length:195 start_codon:yes stop_codon:yes gene_type:complete
MDTILFCIETYVDGTFDITITRTENGKHKYSLEGVAFKIKDDIVFEEGIPDEERNYLKSILINR